MAFNTLSTTQLRSRGKEKIFLPPKHLSATDNPVLVLVDTTISKLLNSFSMDFTSAFTVKISPTEAPWIHTQGFFPFLVPSQPNRCVIPERYRSLNMSFKKKYGD